MLFPLVWALGVLLFFSIARAKLPTYITPAYPPLAILVAGYLGALVARGRAGRGRFALLAPAGLGGLLALATALALVIRGPELARMPLEGWQYPAAALLAAGPLGALLLLWRGRPRGALGMLVAGQAALALVLALGVLPLVSRQRQEPQLRLIRRAESLLGGWRRPGRLSLRQDRDGLLPRRGGPLPRAGNHRLAAAGARPGGGAHP